MAIRPSLAALLFCSALACASGARPVADAGPSTAAPVGPQRVNSPWPIKTRAHLDLWLHGFAMIQDDTTQVPYFKRGYRDQMVVLKNSRNISTLLDASREQLRARLGVNRDLVGAQFLALRYENWDIMQHALQLFLQAEGSPGRAGDRAGDRAVQHEVALLASIFPAAADRDWLRTFLLALRDEEAKYYREYWLQQQRERERVVLRLDSLWERELRPKLTRYLGNTQLQQGDFFLAVPLDGEGRTITGGRNMIATTFPETVEVAVEALYVFVHEAVIPVSSVAVNDNTTPSEKRAGLAERYASSAAVLGGAMLLKRVAPEMADGYARYYLRSANASWAGPDAEAALARVFQLPDAIREALGRQLDVVLGGI